MTSVHITNFKIFARVSFALSLLLAPLITTTSFASEQAHELSEHHALNIHPHMKKKLGEKVLKEAVKFFEDAELAIETKNLDALMALYSENYKNGSHTKESARKIWGLIFKKFDNTSTIHNMRIETYSKEDNLLVIECSGILVGTPAGEKSSSMITIDNWTMESHVLAREDGEWHLIGTTGKERKRFWFDKPMHPLF